MLERHYEAGCRGQRVSVTETGSSGNRKRSQGDTDDEGLTLSASKRRRLVHDRHSEDCTPGTLSQDDYTVGWVCALHIEMAAAQAMLDDIHDNLPTCPNDSNTYSLGNIGTHNIVIACLPSGQYGTISAATVASNMRRSFPSIRVGLMVGIGGGVPGKVDVRLGDVVVGTGVVQYDFGKAVQHGRFQRTGTLKTPLLALMTAIAKLRAIHESEPSKIPSILSGMLNRNPYLTKYAYYGLSQDQLFDGTYDHISSMNNCDHCDSSRLVNRLARDSTDPKIHYGRIASGNQVMKHGRTRDQLAQELDVLCFEMEAAGLMENFPCLVIRGICDYSDSHKNEQWQEYAAATAAAYAKELLSVIPANSISQTRSPIVSSDADGQVLQERRIRLLNLLKFDQIHARRMGVKAAHDETCRWLLEDPEYQHWLDPAKLAEHHGFLWINGKPGAGKPTIMKFAYSHATQTMGNTTIISFFFHARGVDLEKSTAGMYRSLLWQLLGKIPKLQVVLDDPDLIPLSDSDCPTWETEVLRSLFSLSIAKLDQRRLVCFVDALDECDREEVYEMVEDFQTFGRDAVSKGSPLHICFSSRHYPFINIQNGRQLTLEKRPGHERDLEAYIYHKLNLGGGSKTEADELRTEIRDRASGVFLWVILVVKMLNKEFGRGSTLVIRKRRLQEIPIELSELFRDILMRDNEHPERLLLSIEWILYTKRPLKWEELYFALISGLYPDNLTKWNPEEITVHDIKRFILSSSKGLAEITKSKAQTVQFIHESVRDFLLKENGLRDLRREMGLGEENFQSLGHDQLKQCCHAYIKVDISGHVPPGEALPKASSNAAKELRLLMLAKFPFLEYSTRYVLYHADAAADLSQDAFLKEFPLKAWINLDNLFEKHEIRRHTQTASLLYILAENDFTGLVRTTLRHDPRINIQGERYQYPLFAALANSHRHAVKVLLQQERSFLQEDDISVQLEYGQDFAARKGQTPLLWALDRGHVTLAQLLIASREPSLGSKDRRGRTPLSWAAEKGHEVIVKLLLETEKVGVDSKDKGGRTPLSWAAWGGYEAAVKLLLATEKVDVDSKGKGGRTPLSWAAQRGREAVVKLLLATEKVDVDSKDIDGQTPLSQAAREGHEAVVKLLMATEKVDVDSKDIGGLTPLSRAAQGGREAVVKLLLATEKVDVDSKDKDGQTPLSWAAQRGREAVVKLLLATEKVDVDSKDSRGETPLSRAARNGHEAVIKLL